MLLRAGEGGGTWRAAAASSGWLSSWRTSVMSAARPCACCRAGTISGSADTRCTKMRTTCGSTPDASVKPPDGSPQDRADRFTPVASSPSHHSEFMIGCLRTCVTTILESVNNSNER